MKMQPLLEEVLRWHRRGEPAFFGGAWRPVDGRSHRTSSTQRKTMATIPPGAWRCAAHDRTLMAAGQ